MASDSESPFRPVVSAWLALLKKAGEDRWKRFGQTAKVCREFYTNAGDFATKLRGKNCSPTGFVVDESVRSPSFTMALGKAFELVQIFGPTLYHSNPYRHVRPTTPDLDAETLSLAFGPEAAVAVSEFLAQRDAPKHIVARLQSKWLNYLPGQLDLKGHSRLAIDEGLITGRGVLWHEMYRPGPSAPGFLPYSYWGSPDDLFFDPDAEILREGTWCAQRWTGPRWQAEREYGLKSGSLKNYASAGETLNRQAQVESDQHSIYARKEGTTSDTVTLYRVWSKCGLGHELSAPADDRTFSDEVQDLREAMSRFGDHTFLVLCENCDWPLNVPPEDRRADNGMYSEQEVWQRTRWPLPFYEDSDGWPFSPLDFYPVAKQTWPMAHLKMALPLLMFLNWGYSALMGRIHFTSRTLIFHADHLTAEIKSALESGGDLTLVPFTEGLIDDLNKLIQQWQHAPVPIELYNILDRVAREFEKASGLSELLYGMTGGAQIRSATEAQVREQATKGRPAAMADTVEEWQSAVARKENLMSRWKVPGNVVSAFLGEQAGPSGRGMFGDLWDRYVHVPLDYTNPASLSGPPREYEVTIAAGSARKPNLEKDQVDMDQAIQTMLPIADAERQVSGDPSLANALLQAWGASRQMALPMLPDRRAEMQAQQQAAMEQQMAAEQQAAMQQPQQPAAFAA